MRMESHHRRWGHCGAGGLGPTPGRWGWRTSSHLGEMDTMGMENRAPLWGWGWGPPWGHPGEMLPMVC